MNKPPPFGSLLEVVRNCDKYPYSDETLPYDESPELIPFLLNHLKIGILLPSTVGLLQEYNDRQPPPAPFIIAENCITFAECVKTFDERTEVVKLLFDTWRRENTFEALRGWRDELYPVYGDNTHPLNIAFVMERAATAIFGIPTFGVHVNGFVKSEDGEIKMWIAKRASSKPSWPGWLDNIVAGGITYKQTIKETLIKEAMEEASLSFEIASKATPVGAITYFILNQSGTQPETQYIYDLLIPMEVHPKPLDGEVEWFDLWDVNEIKKNLLEGKFKPNCALVVIDFFIRHSFISPDDESDYLDILTRIHRRLDFPAPKQCGP
ncbi:hypothetical protein G9A89_011254 [Geosiphon pyriformis]|nr:hypothetical protein G9A89_011254 [Geosiphon pyriformis]